ncbi:MAG: hypothetical protein ABF651_04450 [Sporolactobacillus sp.]
MRRVMLSALIIVVFFLIFARYTGFPTASPTITYFPEAEPSLKLSGKTQIHLHPQAQALTWRIQSHSASPVYLLQNFSLLYRNNQLIAINNVWKQQVRSLLTVKHLQAEAGYFQGLSVHQAEEHNGEKVRGREVFSSDQLFVMKKGDRWFAFSDQHWTSAEKYYAGQLTSEINQQQAALTQKAAKIYGFNPSDYKMVLLSDLNETNADRFFPGSPADSRRIAGQLWEGLYKTMVRGFDMGEAQYEPVKGSSLPILLIGRDHLLVVIESSAQRVIVLKQEFRSRAYSPDSR